MSKPRTPNFVPVQYADKARERLRKLYNIHGGWREVAALPGLRTASGKMIPPGTLCAIAKGRDPKDPEVRSVLGLPALLPAPACAKCGGVHVARRCTAKREGYEMASDLAEFGHLR